MTDAGLIGSKNDDAAWDEARPGLTARLFSRKAAAMLWRNTVVSTLIFGISVGLLWLLVEFFGMSEVAAAAIGFITANSLHYALGRAWIFRGTDRAIASGYLYFFCNGGLGLAITVGLYAIYADRLSRRSNTRFGRCRTGHVRPQRAAQLPSSLIDVCKRSPDPHCPVLRQL